MIKGNTMLTNCYLQYHIYHNVMLYKYCSKFEGLTTSDWLTSNRHE